MNPDSASPQSSSVRKEADRALAEAIDQIMRDIQKVRANGRSIEREYFCTPVRITRTTGTNVLVATDNRSVRGAVAERVGLARKDVQFASLRGLDHSTGR